MVRKDNILLNVSMALILMALILMALIVTLAATDASWESHVWLTLGLAAGVFIIEKTLLGYSLSFTHLTLPTFFLGLYIFIMCIPSVFRFVEMADPLRYSYLFAVQSVLLTFPLGVGLANFFDSNPTEVIRSYTAATLQRNRQDLRLYSAYKVFLILSVVIVVLYYVASVHIQLIEVLSATSIGPEALRFAENDLPKLIQYLFEVLRRFIFPVCLVYCYFMSTLYGSKWRYMLWFLLPTVMLVDSLSLDRGPVIAVLMMMLLAYGLRGRNSVISFARSRTAVTLAAVALIGGVISVMQYQTMFRTSAVVYDSWYVLSYRMFWDPSVMASRAFESYNSDSGFLHGSAIRLFSLLPGFRYTESVGGDRMAAAPVSFVGDLWRNWGWTGVLAGSLSLGFVFQMYQLKFFRTKNAESLCFHVLLLVTSASLIYGNALGIMSTTVFGFTLLWGLATSGRRNKGPGPVSRGIEPLEEIQRRNEAPRSADYRACGAMRSSRLPNCP